MRQTLTSNKGHLQTSSRDLESISWQEEEQIHRTCSPAGGRSWCWNGISTIDSAPRRIERQLSRRVPSLPSIVRHEGGVPDARFGFDEVPCSSEGGFRDAKSKKRPTTRHTVYISMQTLNRTEEERQYSQWLISFEPIGVTAVKSSPSNGSLMRRELVQRHSSR